MNDVNKFVFKDISRVFNITLKKISNMISDGNLNSLNLEKVHKIVNHPVHIMENSGNFSPSSFIPFCKFRTWLGVKLDKFDVPVCNQFKPTILNDQLCYKVDLNSFKTLSTSNDFKKGLTFYVDLNQDREIPSEKSPFMIYLSTLGIDKFALLWREAQLRLPYVCL